MRHGITCVLIASQLALSGGSALAAGSIKETLKKAQAAEKAGDLETAEYHYRKTWFVRPGSSRVRSSLKKLTRARAEKFLTDALALEEAYKYSKVDLLRAAYALDPKNKKIVAEMEKLGFVLIAGTFHEGEIVGLAPASAKDDEVTRRRAELRLTPTFQMIRRGPFRFFTNVDVKQAKAVINQMINSNLSHYREYCRVMAPFGLNENVDTIDLVLFNTKEEYHRHVRMPGSAGVYMPSLGAGFFYRDGGYDFATMLHEMTHQLNHKVLGAFNHGWYEEGISEYFGAASMSQGGKRMKLGIPEGHRYGVFKNMVRNHGGTGGYTPLSQFSRQQRAQLTSEYYAQAWALTFYLMEYHPKGRLILFDYVAATSGLAQKLGMNEATADLEVILKAYGLTLAEFEAGFLRHYREN